MILQPQRQPGKLQSGTATPSGKSPPARLLLAALILCIGMALGRGLGWWLDRPLPTRVPEIQEGPRRRVAVGPWGTLEILRIEIELPDEFIGTRPPPVAESRWDFPGLTAKQVEALFAENDLSDAQRKSLLNPGRWDIRTNGVSVKPGTQIILGLSPGARQRLYSILATNGANLVQQWAFKLPSDSVDDWFEGSGLSPQTVQLLQRLIYPRGDAVCFSDLNEALSEIPDDAEKGRLVKMLSRHSTLLVRLHVGEGEDIEPLVRYWSKGGNGKNVRSLLASLARTPGGASLDITHLLPHFARSRVYTFPFPTDDPQKKHRDCAWTAMNFFSRQPDDRFYDFDYTRQVIDRDYFPIQDDPEFGDVFWFSDGEGAPLHVAVYIADDILFTKNGADFNEPWILTEMKDLQVDYTGAQPPRVEIFRRKGA